MKLLYSGSLCDMLGAWLSNASENTSSQFFGSSSLEERQPKAAGIKYFLSCFAIYIYAFEIRMWKNQGEQLWLILSDVMSCFQCHYIYCRNQ